MGMKKNVKENFIPPKQEKRVQTSILSSSEKRVLIWMAERIPRSVNSDHLTLLGVVGAFIAGTGYALTNYSIHFFWMASLGYIINWFGDSLDGTLARVRNAQRPVYGFFLDHNVDSFTVLFICLGLGLSPLISFWAAMLILAGYLLLSIFTYINTYLKGEFKISFSLVGPTEFRIVAILINTFFIFTSDLNRYFYIMSLRTSLYDMLALAIAVILFITFITSFFSDLKEFARIDPPKTKL
jgi:archaetidylinositol phosphate synthase